MKKSIISIITFFVLGTLLLITGIFIDIRLFPAGFLFAILFLAYFLAFLNERKRATKEQREYREIHFPSRYLLISNSLGMLTILSIATALESTSSGTFKGMLYMLVIIFVLPVNVGIYFFILLKHLISKSKENSNK